MNPEENNPLANPGVPNFGISNDSTNPTGNNFSMSDSLSMANDNLTAAGMAAAPTIPGPANFNIGAPADSNPNLTFNEEPLVPAAPVPGSIGSVMSAPASASSPAEPLANPFAPNNDAQSGAMPVPDVQPQAAPYNPFAPSAAPTETTPAADPAPTPTPAAAAAIETELKAPAMTPAKDTINPAFQPTPTKSKTSHAKKNPLTMVLIIISLLLLISTITFAALYITAKNNPKIVYVPTVSSGESNSQVSLLTCSQDNEMNWLINDAYVVPASRVLTINYKDNQIGAILDEQQAALGSEEDAFVAYDIFINVAGTSIVPTTYEAMVNGNMLDMTTRPSSNPLTDDEAMNYLYGSTVDVPSTSLDDVQGYFESAGYVCNVE